MTSSWKAVTLFGVSVDLDTAAEAVIVGAAGGGGGGGGGGSDGDEGEPYPVSAGITVERRAAADGSRMRGSSAMSSKRDAAASRLKIYEIDWESVVRCGHTV